MHPFPCSIIKHSVDSAGKKKTLWNRAGLFPQLNFTYKVAPSGMLMFSFSSDKTYPSYWMTTPTTYYMNVYSSIIGNPDLKPQLSYSMQLNYVPEEQVCIRLIYKYTAR